MSINIENIELKDYRIIRLVAHGGMASVFLAEHKHNHKVYAIKIIKNDEAQKDSTFIKRFQLEFEISSKLNHENIIKFYEAGKTDNYLFVVMEYIDGYDLKNLIEKKAPFSIKTAIKIILDLASALFYAHQNNVIHRDLKPANVLIDKNDRIILTDFGISRMFNDFGETKHLTKENFTMGTLYYMSPEQLKSSKVDQKADLYSLGVLFYELLTGELPYTGKTEYKIMEQHISAPIPQLFKYVDELQPIINKLMAKKPEERYSNGLQLIEDLNPFYYEGQVEKGEEPKVENISQVTIKDAFKDLSKLNFNYVKAKFLVWHKEYQNYWLSFLIVSIFLISSILLINFNQIYKYSIKDIIPDKLYEFANFPYIPYDNKLYLGFLYEHEKLSNQIKINLENQNFPKIIELIQGFGANIQKKIIAEIQLYMYSKSILNELDNKAISINFEKILFYLDKLILLAIPLDINTENLNQMKGSVHSLYANKLLARKKLNLAIEVNELFFDYEAFEQYLLSLNYSQSNEFTQKILEKIKENSILEAKQFLLFENYDEAFERIKEAYFIGKNVTISKMLTDIKQLKLFHSNKYLNINWVKVPQGCFNIGYDSSLNANYFNHCVKSFKITKTEMTRGNYLLYLQDRNIDYIKHDFIGKESLPMTNISFNEIKNYITWLNSKTQKQFSLPTEAEWEYAAKSGTDLDYTTGDILGIGDENCCGFLRKKDITAVGSFRVNKFGLFDMGGNVSEWTCSEYSRLNSYKFARCVSEESIFYVIKGGNYNSSELGAKANVRLPFNAYEKNNEVGFRLVDRKIAQSL